MMPPTTTLTSVRTELEPHFFLVYLYDSSKPRLEAKTWRANKDRRPTEVLLDEIWPAKQLEFRIIKPWNLCFFVNIKSSIARCFLTLPVLVVQQGSSSWPNGHLRRHLQSSTTVSSIDRFKVSAPLKFNMEPENLLFEKETHLPNLHFRVPCKFSGVYVVNEQSW